MGHMGCLHTHHYQPMGTWTVYICKYQYQYQVPGIIFVSCISLSLCVDKQWQCWDPYG